MPTNKNWSNGVATPGAWSRCLFLLLCALSAYTVEVCSAETGTLRLGTGPDSGVYDQLGRVLAQILSESDETTGLIVPITTEGSVENLARLREGDIDIAIVQNDIAYYVYEGVRGYNSFPDFRAGIPLFAEYVQILVRDRSEIRTLGDLVGKRVAIGAHGSGSYHNALDVMAQAGIRPGIDFEVAYLNVGQALPMLEDGQLDSVVTTGALFPLAIAEQDQGVRALSLSRDGVNSLAIRYPYYVPELVTISTKEVDYTISTVSVMAMLVFSDRIAPAVAHEIVRVIDEATPLLARRLDERLSFVSIDQANKRRPVPLHPGVRSYLLERGHIKSSATLYWIGFIGALVIAFVMYAQIRCNAYDRLGNVRMATGAWPYKIMLGFSRFAVLIVVIVCFVFVVFSLVEAIQFFEGQYARENNIRNEFADVGFWDAVLWMFMFMGAGHTEDMFPLSTAGRILATTLPFLGIGGILSFSLLGLEKSRARLADKKRGRLPTKAKNHVLVCGWNEKAIGIVYGLTSDDVPRKKPVVVVAEIDGDMPLENHDFDPSYVSYQRGDSADHSVLVRANIEYADAAVVVAGIKKRSGRNLRSILSVMALKEAFANANTNKKGHNEGLFVAAELIHEENQPLFHACGADAVITAELVANRVAAQCCVNRHIVDFVLDALTYDDASELYSTRVSKVGNATRGRLYWVRRLQSHLGRPERPPPLRNKRLGDVRDALGRFGVNVVALSKSSKYRDILVGDMFGDRQYLFPKDEEDSETLLADDNILLFLADQHDDVHQAALKIEESASRQTDDRPDIASRASFVQETFRVLLVGDWRRCAAVAKMLAHVPWCETTILTESIPAGAESVESCVVGDFTQAESWCDAGIARADRITILAQSGEQTNAGQAGGEHGEVDARAIFIARFARSFLWSEAADRIGPQPLIAAEMLGHRSRELFLDAGIDVIIPSSLLVERMLTKLVYSKGSVCRFLMALLAFEDNRHISTLILDELDHPDLLGKSFEELMMMLPSTIQLLGVLPADPALRKKLVNTVGDFAYHFLTTPRSSEKHCYRSAAGDALLVVIDRRDSAG